MVYRWLAGYSTVSYPRTFENTFVRKYFIRTVRMKVLSKVVVALRCTFVRKYFRTFVRISIKVVIQLLYVVLSYFRSILFLSSYGSTRYVRNTEVSYFRKHGRKYFRTLSTLFRSYFRKYFRTKVLLL